MNKLIALIPILILCSCASVSVTITKNGLSPKNPDDIKVIFENNDKDISPNCKAEQIGFISTSWEWTTTRALNSAKEKAAEIGGDYLKATVITNDRNHGRIKGTVYYCIK